MGPAPQCHDVSQTRGKMRRKTPHLWSVKAYVWASTCVKPWWTIYLIALVGRSVSMQSCWVSLPITPLNAGEHQPNGRLSRKNHFQPVNYLHVSLPHKSCRFRRHNNLLSKSTRHLVIKGKAVGVWACVWGKLEGGCVSCGGVRVFREGGGALREANIFSGLRQHSENTFLMLMYIRSEPGKY